MSLIIDVTIILVILTGLLIYYSTDIARTIKYREIPYVVWIYLFAAPYKGLMAKYTPYTDLVIDLLLFVYFLIMCFRRKIRLCPNHIVWIVFFMCAVILYSIFGAGLMSILGIQEVRFHLGVALLIIIITTTLKSRKGIGQIARIFEVNAALIALMDVTSYILYRQSVLSDIISNRNFVSIYELIGLLGTIYAFKISHQKILPAFATIIMMDLLIMKSSSVFLGLLAIVGICLLKVFGIISKQMYKLIALVVFVAVVFTIKMIATPKAFDNEYVKWVQNFRASEDYTRTLIWEEALYTAKDNLLYGIGPDKFRDTRTNYEFPTHNDYLKVLVETGIIGMTGFILFIILSIRDTLRIRDANVKQYMFCALLALLIFILFHGYINYVIFWVVLCAPYWWRNVECREQYY